MSKVRIEWNDHVWQILGTGVVDAEAGTTLCHLESTVEFQQQKNGRVPRQVLEPIPTDVVQRAQLDHIPMPSDAYRWNRAIRGAFKKGILACVQGVPRYRDPYEDKRNASGRLTWSRSFALAWQDGWDHARKHLS